MSYWKIDPFSKQMCSKNFVWGNMLLHCIGINASDVCMCVCVILCKGEDDFYLLGRLCEEMWDSRWESRRGEIGIGARTSSPLVTRRIRNRRVGLRRVEGSFPSPYGFTPDQINHEWPINLETVPTNRYGRRYPWTELIGHPLLGQLIAVDCAENDEETYGSENGVIRTI